MSGDKRANEKRLSFKRCTSRSDTSLLGSDLKGEKGIIPGASVKARAERDVSLAGAERWPRKKNGRLDAEREKSLPVWQRNSWDAEWGGVPCYHKLRRKSHVTQQPKGIISLNLEKKPGHENRSGGGKGCVAGGEGG